MRKVFAKSAKEGFSEITNRGHYTGKDFNAVKTKFEEIAGKIEGKNNAQKAMKARTLHYLANIEIVKGNLTAADKLLQKSIATTPTPEAYQCLSYVFNNMKTV